MNEAYLTLALVPGIGPARFLALLERFGSAEEVLRAPAGAIRRVAGMSDAATTAVTSADRELGGRVLALLAPLGAEALSPGAADYPPMLRTIPDPPPVLFAQGDLGLLARPAVAVVGSRDHSLYGAEAARAIARAAADAGLVVVSGMARGLDAMAHRGALEAKGGTIGVLGNGLGVVYPAANRDLYERVASKGLLLTEFPPGERPQAGSFPRRNRLISGLARVTVVVEAAERSGALTTAGLALGQGREVLAVPGPITSPVSVGTNRLIRDGAAPLLELKDLLDHYPEVAAARAPEARNAPAGSPSPAPHPLHSRLLATLRKQPLPAELLIEQSGAAPEQVFAALSTLELRGIVRLRAGLYQATAELFA